MTQKQALDLLKCGYNVFLTGAAGSGKTFLLNDKLNGIYKSDLSPVESKTNVINNATSKFFVILPRV